MQRVAAVQFVFETRFQQIQTNHELAAQQLRIRDVGSAGNAGSAGSDSKVTASGSASRAAA